MESIWCTIQNLVYLNEVFVIEYSSRDHLMPYMVLTINAINKYIDFFQGELNVTLKRKILSFNRFLYLKRFYTQVTENIHYT